VIALLGVGWALVAELLVMPSLRGGVPTQVDYYHWLGQAGGEQIEVALLRPEAWAALALLVLCCGGLPLLRLDWALLALPPLAADMLSTHAPQPAVQLQYGLALVIPMLLASGAGARQLSSFRPGMMVPLALPAVIAGLLFGPIAAIAFHRVPVPPPGLRGLRACTVQIPRDAPVAADDSAAVPLAARPELRLITAAQPGDWVVVDHGGRIPDYTDRAIREWVVGHLSGQRRRPLCNDGRFVLWSPAGA
jgi:Predicted membrane protein (DUF2079)